MAYIDITEEVIEHKDEEIIEFLSEKMASVRRLFMKAVENGNSEVLYAAMGDVNEIYAVLRALDRRNKEDNV